MHTAIGCYMYMYLWTVLRPMSWKKHLTDYFDLGKNILED